MPVEPAEPSRADPTRRTLVRGAALSALAVPLVAACGSGKAGASSGSNPPISDPITATSDVEVGGALFVDPDEVPGGGEEKGIVVTQPVSGEFHAFSRDCTHAHCAVTDILDGRIHCPCHDSLYSMQDGSVQGGPAPSPLAKVDILVKGGKVFRA